MIPLRSPESARRRRLVCGLALLFLPGLALAGPRVRIGVEGNRDGVLSWVDEQGRPTGFSPELLREMSRVGGIELELVPSTWSNLLSEFDAGRLDALANVMITDERRARMDFSIGHAYMHGVAYVRSGRAVVRRTGDLAGKRISVLRGTLEHTTALRHGGWGGTIVAVTDRQALLDAVVQGECDVALATRRLPRVVADDRGLRVGFLEDVVYTFHLAVHKGDSATLERLNEALATVRQNGAFERLYDKWIGPIEPHPIRLADLRPYLLPVALGVLLLGGLIGWQRHLLAQRVRDRTAELAQRVAEVERLNAELEAFSYSVSHDLRSPLRNITGFLELLGQRPDAARDPAESRYIETVQREAARMGRLIDDLLAFSRLGRAELKEGRVDLGELVADVRAALAPSGGGRRIEWRVGPLPAVAGDPALLRVVVENLLSNALKFTQRREPAVIELGCVPATTGEPGWVTVFVRDNGAGFNPKYAGKLFGVFSRLHSRRDFEGTGIGLANVKRIVERHGGRVWAEGELDKGATFYFNLKPHTP